jgi:hypothetical protein
VSGGRDMPELLKFVSGGKDIPELLKLVSDGKEMPEILKLASGGKGLPELLRLFETIGQLNRPVGGQEQQDYLLFPCFFAGDSGWGEWLFSFSQENDGSAAQNDRYGLSFFLEMSHLGEIHLQLFSIGDALRGVFSAADQKVVDYLERAVPELTSKLANLDYQPIELLCQVEKSTNLQKLKEVLGKRTEQESFALLDVTI